MALDIQLRLLPHDSPALIRILDNATAVYTEIGELESAVSYATWGLELVAADDSPRDYHAGSLHANLAYTLLLSDRPKEAARQAELAIERYTIAGVNELDLSGAYATLGGARLAMGDRNAAFALYRHAMQARGEHSWTIQGGPRTAFDYAELSWQLGRSRDEAAEIARKVYRSAIEAEDETLRERVSAWFAAHALGEP